LSGSDRAVTLFGMRGTSHVLPVVEFWSWIGQTWCNLILLMGNWMLSDNPAFVQLGQLRLNCHHFLFGQIC
jgi:hypothetical protein